MCKKLRKTLNLDIWANRRSASTWASRAFWAISDQGMFALTNFATYILLARWLTPSRYGVYILTSSAFLIFGIIHTSLITDPMLVFSAKRSDLFPDYYQVLKNLHWRLSFLFSALVLASTLISCMLGFKDLSNSLAGLAISMPFILFLWLSRRVFYVRFSPKYAAYGGLVYAASNMVLLYVAHKLGWLNPLMAYLIVGTVSLSVAGILNCKLRPVVYKSSDMQQILSDHWKYGRWILLSALVTWIPSNMAYFFLATFGLLDDSAAFRSLMNLLMPALNVYTAMGIAVVPYFSRFVQSGRIAELKKASIISVLWILLFAALTIALLIPWHHLFFRLLYSGMYADLSHLAPLLSVSLIFLAFSAIFNNVFRALHATNRLFQIAVLTACANVLLSIWLIPQHHVYGAVITTILSSILETSFMIITFIRLRQLKRVPQG